MKEYNIGEKVWWATWGHREVVNTCPICFGKLYLKLVLGNGEEVQIECDYCERGFGGAKGEVSEYKKFSDVKEITITGKEVKEDTGGRKVKYSYLNYSLNAGENIFSTKEEAETVVKDNLIKYENEQDERNAKRKRSNQSHYSWLVGYHKKRLKEAQREIDYHSRKINEINK